jgi:hypothetical protein
VPALLKLEVHGGRDDVAAAPTISSSSSSSAAGEFRDLPLLSCALLLRRGVRGAAVMANVPGIATCSRSVSSCDPPSLPSRTPCTSTAPTEGPDIKTSNRN